MRIAVVGANGFLGREIVRQAIAKGHEVIGIYHRNFSNIPAELKKISMQSFLKGNENVNDIIFSAGSFKNSVEENNRLNCEDLYQLSLKYNHCRFLYISSANVYGSAINVISESSPFYNPSNYGLSKLSAETIVSGMPNYAIVRLVYIYGENLDNGSFLPFILKKAKKTGKISLFGGGERVQDYLHVKDAANLCLKTFDCSENGIYLGATGHSISNLEIAKLVCENILGACEVELLDKPESSVSFYYDPSWTMKKLDWQPKIGIVEGIKEMLL